jgi:hypothetical protein
MKNLNYSRELYNFAKKFLAGGPYIESNELSLLLEGYTKVCKLHHKSVKFTLPDAGRVNNFDTQNFSLDGVVGIPFKYICLEYYIPPITRKEGDPYFYIDGVPQYTKEESCLARKRIVYAVDMDDIIEIIPAHAGTHDDYIKAGEIWSVLPAVKFIKESKSFVFPEKILGSVSDYTTELGAFLFFIKAMSRSNVKVDKRPPSVKGKANVKRNGFVPYDSYHVLTVDLNYVNEQSNPSTGHDTHASPREHIRRGHVRTLASGKKIWVNDTVVNKGVSNVVNKTYAIV